MNEQVFSSGNKFSISEALKFGWNTTKSNLMFLVGVEIVSLLVQSFSQGIRATYTQSFPFMNLDINPVGLIFYIIKIIVDIGLIKIALDFVDGKKPEFMDLFKHYNLFVKYFLGSILYGLIVGIGLILLVVPGIILMIRLQFYSYLIIDKGLGPIEALKSSWQLTKDSGMNLFLYGLAVLGVILLGVLALIIGIFVAIPVTMLATAYIYRKLAIRTTVTPQAL